MVTDRALLGAGDPDRSVMEPARVPGHGSVPAPVARAWLREGLDRPVTTASGGDPSPSDASGADLRDRAAAMAAMRGWLGCGCAGCTPPRTVGTWSRWTRGGGCSVGCCAGCWCCVMTCAPRRGARRRSCTPTTPRPFGEGGLTGFREGNGKCARCNQTKEAPGWRTRVVTRDTSHRDRDDARDRDRVRDGDGERDSGRDGGDDRRGGRSARRVVRVTTPLGHQYESEPPPLLGWGSQSPVRTSSRTGPDEAVRASTEPTTTLEPTPTESTPTSMKSAQTPTASTQTPARESRRRTRNVGGCEPGPAHRRKRPLRRAANAAGAGDTATSDHQPPRTPAVSLPDLTSLWRASAPVTGRPPK